MTRKDYVLLASALRNAKPWNADANPHAPATAAWLASVYSVSDSLSKDNPRFDAEFFHRACEAIL